MHRVQQFVEKPDRERAEAFLADGNYLWNSGVFVWHSAAIAGALETHAPAIWSALRNASPAEIPAAYAGIEGESIDTGVMERQDDVRVLPIDFGWSDVGAWTALPDVLPQDQSGNTASGGAQLFAEESTTFLPQRSSGM